MKNNPIQIKLKMMLMFLNSLKMNELKGAKKTHVTNFKFLSIQDKSLQHIVINAFDSLDVHTHNEELTPRVVWFMVDSGCTMDAINNKSLAFKITGDIGSAKVAFSSESFDKVGHLFFPIMGLA